MTTARFHYYGVRRDGVCCTGTLAPGETPETAARRRYRAGWRWLRIEDPAGEEVATVDRDEMTGRRCWWARRDDDN